MHTWIVLFRGINVGGRNVVRMKELTAALEGAGLQDVRTYIQSGNVVCRSRHRSKESIQGAVVKAVKSSFDLDVRILILSSKNLNAAVAECPFVADDEKLIHYFFLQQPAKSGCESALDELKSDREQWELTNQVFYLYAPDGIGRSRLAAAAEKRLSVTATARNLRTVRRLVAMCAELP
ncbi:MAG: DUF1697 domain-containing protein [Fuerstiella sp.]